MKKKDRVKEIIAMMGFNGNKFYKSYIRKIQNIASGMTFIGAKTYSTEDYFFEYKGIGYKLIETYEKEKDNKVHHKYRIEMAD